MANPTSVTMREVARAANVSISTVSRALRGDPSISPQSTRRVKHAAAELKYRPHRRKRDDPAALRKSGLHAKRIAFVSLGLPPSVLTHPSTGGMIHGVESALTASGAELQLLHLPDPSDEPQALMNLRLDAVVLLGQVDGRVTCTSDCPALAKLRGLPAIWLLARPEGCAGDVVAIHDASLGGRAARYLIERGHRHLAVLNPHADTPAATQREDGFAAECRRANRTVLRLTGKIGNGAPSKKDPSWDAKQAEALVERLASARPRPTALFCASDMMAALAYQALARHGIQPGRDVSVISANNEQSLIASLRPPLTTFDIQTHELGRAAVRQLAARIGDASPGPDVQIVIEPVLIERESVRPWSSNGNGRANGSGRKPPLSNHLSNVSPAPF